MNSEFPPDVQKRAEDEQEVMRDILFEHADDRDAVFIDNALEHDVAMLSYAEHLGRTLSDEVSDEEVRVAYRSIHFISIVTALHGCNKGVSLESLRELPEADVSEAREYIRKIAELYGERRPTVMGYVEAYMPEIDPSGRYGYLAETVAGLVGSQVDDGLQAWAAADAVASWDGIVPDNLSR